MSEQQPTSLVEAVGKASEALEYVERARGHLYSFHQLMGRADIEFGHACDRLVAAGLEADALELDRDIVGRNVLDGRWTYQVVDEFDELYYTVARAAVARLVERHTGGERHAFERQLKERRRTVGLAGHEMEPPRSGHDGGDDDGGGDHVRPRATWHIHRLTPVRADAESLFIAAHRIPQATVGDMIELDADDATDVRTGEIVDRAERDGDTYFRVALRGSVTPETDDGT